jgi:hypothetical protein
VTATMTTTEQELWQDLEANPGSENLRLILADLLQEPGCSAEQEELALALRWAVSKGKQPWRQPWGTWPWHWHWHSAGGWAMRFPNRLPPALFEALPDRTAGMSESATLREAYICLGHGLATLREILACP